MTGGQQVHEEVGYLGMQVGASRSNSRANLVWETVHRQIFQRVLACMESEQDKVPGAGTEPMSGALEGMVCLALGWRGQKSAGGVGIPAGRESVGMSGNKIGASMLGRTAEVNPVSGGCSE